MIQLAESDEACWWFIQFHQSVLRFLRLTRLDSIVSYILFSKFLQTAHGDLAKLRKLIATENADTPPSAEYLKHLAGMLACLSFKLQKIGQAYEDFKQTYYAQKFKRIKVFGELKAEYDLRVN